METKTTIARLFLPLARWRNRGQAKQNNPISKLDPQIVLKRVSHSFGVLMTTLVIASLILCAAGKEATAGAIKEPLPTSLNGGKGVVGPGLGSGNTVAAGLRGRNNDNKAEKGDSFVSMDLTFDKLDTIDIIFEVENTGGFTARANAREDAVRNPCGKDPCGTTEYWYEVVIGNNTGQDWSGLGFQLGFGTGNNFQLSNALDFLDFDTPDKDPKPSRNAQEQNFQHQANTIEWTGSVQGKRGRTQAGAFFFEFDVPDFNDQMPAAAATKTPDGKTVTGYRFTLRVTPVLAVVPIPVPEPSVSSVTGSANRVGVLPPPGRDAGAQVGILPKFTFTGPIDLGASTVTIHSLLGELGSGEVEELAQGVPITLNPRPGSTPNAAIFETPGGVRPSFRMEIKNRDPEKGLLESNLRIDRGTIPVFPQECAGGSRPTTNLATSFTIDDGVNPPVVVSTVQRWRCLDLIGGDPEKPRSLRVP